ncbi:SGNH/GDSL hydrolase family protein [Lonepinella sp. BR2271]|uniref:SGNH/GDSL hydrolase family protein n=1 Tax=Lonepinella sp. BR2271 TaxID=3434550 RepID=UPI003F6DABA4
MKNKNPVLLFLTLLLSSLLMTWFTQGSINAYWQQTYHEESPLSPLEQYDWWKKGQYYREQTEALLAQYGLLHTSEGEMNNPSEMPLEPTVEIPVTDIPTPKMELVNRAEEKAFVHSDDSVIRTTPNVENTEERVDNIISSVEKKTALPAEEKAESTVLIQEDPQRLAVEPESAVVEENPPVSEPIEDKMVYLKSGDKVFFAGDSLMQGVAPVVQRLLKDKYKINSVNLSKQSTGLSYPSFFDWPKTIEQTLAADKAIKLVVIFLGPNDPWDFPNPAKHYVYLKFKSPEWETVYKSRIERIIAAAKKHDVSIIWLGIPFMKANKLNTQTRYIDTLIKTTVGNRVIYLPTDNLLSQGKNGYVDSIKLDNKVVRVRTKDGIHFSIPGAKYLGDYVLQHIRYQ